MNSRGLDKLRAGDNVIKAFSNSVYENLVPRFEEIQVAEDLSENVVVRRQYGVPSLARFCSANMLSHSTPQLLPAISLYYRSIDVDGWDDDPGGLSRAGCGYLHDRHGLH